jgi:SPX domain protein involved in polyphosphate accumulation
MNGKKAALPMPKSMNSSTLIRKCPPQHVARNKIFWRNIVDSSLHNWRYEIKMVFENANRFEVESWVKLHSFAFSSAYPDRQVNNIYFDTFSMDTLNDHIAGAGQRRKFRFRWYGKDLSVAQGHLEIKHKEIVSGWKSTQFIQQNVRLANSNWKDIQAALQTEAKGIFNEMLSVSRPVLINTYQRQYFVSADEDIRLTLDHDMQGYDQSFGIKPNLNFKLPNRDLVIIELKTANENAKSLANTLAEFPLYAEAFSKYVQMASRVIEQ